MLARKSIQAVAAGALLAASLPAFANHDRWDRDHRRPSRVVVEHRQPVRVVERPVYVERRVVVERPVYVERPAPVYDRGYGYGPVYEPGYGYGPGYEPGYGQPVYTPVYNEPAPVAYPAPRQVNPVGAGVGAVVGAVIGSQIGHGHSRGATAAVGAVLGGVIGSQF